MSYVLKKDTSGKYMFNLKAGNGETILTSESYADKSGAQDGIASVQNNGVNDARYEHRTSSSGQAYFVLKAAHGEQIGRSEMYSSAAAAKSGVESVKKNCTSTTIKEE